LFRTVTSVVLPGLNWAIGGAESWLYSFGALRPAVNWVDGVLSGWLLNGLPFYLPNIVLLVFFAVVLGLNAVRSRFWCRYLCPLGGLLALVSKISFVRHRVDAARCISCGKCAKLCPTGAVDPARAFAAEVSECTACMNCVDGCPVQAISFGRKLEVVTRQDAGRRWFLSSLGAAAVVAVFLRFVPAAAARVSAYVRPPGSTEETLFARCIRCGECLKVCPTGVIQPAEAVGGKLWTPFLATRLGYCDYSCNACGAICPTGAIAELPIEVKRKTVIGVARIDKSRCIPWAEGRDCLVCEEMCPIPEKAIKLSGGEGQGHGRGGARHPEVVEDLCIGCGICEKQCPVAGESAIRVFPL
jgi:MauM/NapG family ferredoxin protein